MTDQELATISNFVDECRNATPQEAVAKARELAIEWSSLERRGTLLLAELGVYHRRAADDPAVLEAAGCKTIREFESTVLHAAHSTIGLISSAYKYFPEQLTPERFVAIGPVKMRRAIAAVKGKEMSPRQLEGVLEMVESADNQWHATKRLDAVTGQSARASLLIEGDEVDIRDIEFQLADPEIQAGADSADPAKIIRNALIEAGTEWRK